MLHFKFERAASKVNFLKYNEMKEYLFTSELVSEGHTDKLSDQVFDYIG